MLLLYILGSYIRRYNLKEKFNSKLLFKILIITTVLNILLNTLITLATGGKSHIPFARDCSIFIVIEAVTLMMLFLKIEFHSDLINKAASHVFAVYLFEGAFRQIIQNFIFNYTVYEGKWNWVLINIAIALIAMISCMAIDVLVEVILKPIRNLMLKITNVIIRITKKYYINFMCLSSNDHNYLK